MNPKISVIMGVYNCKSSEKLIRSVQSIIDQSFTDWEFLICDDGSSNDTFFLLNKVKEMDPRIQILHYDKNISLGNALNTCLRSAKGKYIARQDDDDISEKDRFEEQVKFLDKNSNYCMVGSCAKVYDDNGVWGHYIVPKKPSKYDFLKNSPFMHPTILMRKEALEAVDCYRIAPETRRCEDYDLFMRMYARGLYGYNLQKELYQYYILRNDHEKHRPMKVRIDEVKVRYKGFKALRLYPKAIPYVVKPIIAGIIPAKLFSIIQNKQYKG